MRPWLPQTRQAHLDATIRAVRLNALPPVKLELPKVIKCYVSVCDGSGTRSLFVTQRVGAHYQLASVMMKLAGVADAMVLRELSKSDMDDMSKMGLTCPLTFCVGAFAFGGFAALFGFFIEFDPQIRARLFSIFSKIDMCRQMPTIQIKKLGSA